MSYKKFAQDLYAVADQLDALGKRGLADKIDGVVLNLIKSAAGPQSIAELGLFLKLNEKDKEINSIKSELDALLKKENDLQSELANIEDDLKKLKELSPTAREGSAIGRRLAANETNNIARRQQIIGLLADYAGEKRQLSYRSYVVSKAKEQLLAEGPAKKTRRKQSAPESPLVEKGLFPEKAEIFTEELKGTQVKSEKAVQEAAEIAEHEVKVPSANKELSSYKDRLPNASATSAAEIESVAKQLSKAPITAGSSARKDILRKLPTGAGALALILSAYAVIKSFASSADDEAIMSALDALVSMRANAGTRDAEHQQKIAEYALDFLSRVRAKLGKPGYMATKEQLIFINQLEADMKVFVYDARKALDAKKHPSD